MIRSSRGRRFARQVEPGAGGTAAAYLDPLKEALTGRGAGRSDSQKPLGGLPVAPFQSVRLLERSGGVPQPANGQFGDGYTEEDVTLILRRMPPEKLSQIQRQMQEAELLPDNFRAFGFVDGSTRQAFAEVLEMSNTRSTAYENTLTALASGSTTTDDIRKEQARKFAELGFQTKTHVFQSTDPATLRASAEQAFTQALGRKPNQQEMDRFVNGFLATERSDQQAMFDAEDREELESRNRTLAKVDLENGGDGGLDAFMLALSAQESGGNYQAVNRGSGAQGRFQIMPSNWSAWAKEAGLPAGAAKTPENQDRVARFKMAQYKEQFGSWDAVAVAWYAGPGAAQEYVKNPNAPRFTRQQKGGPTIREYASSVMGRMGGATTAVGEGGGESDQLWANLQRMIADAPGKITVGPRTRSYEEQVKLYERYTSGRGALAAKPGTSPHGDGRANDLKYENQAVKRWALQNAGRYGLAFPLLNAGEDWHVELAGGGGASGGAASVSRTMSTVNRADPGTAAYEQARMSNPAEARAYDIGGQFNNFLAVLNRGVGISV